MSPQAAATDVTYNIRHAPAKMCQAGEPVKRQRDPFSSDSLSAGSTSGGSNSTSSDTQSSATSKTGVLPVWSSESLPPLSSDSAGPPCPESSGPPEQKDTRGQLSHQAEYRNKPQTEHSLRYSSQDDPSEIPSNGDQSLSLYCSNDNAHQCQPETGITPGFQTMRLTSTTNSNQSLSQSTAEDTCKYKLNTKQSYIYVEKFLIFKSVMLCVAVDEVFARPVSAKRRSTDTGTTPEKYVKMSSCIHGRSTSECTPCGHSFSCSYV